ncbi:hypothetical protein PAMA_000862 [Pampus argenteus]
MWRTAALYLGLVLSHLGGEGSVVKVLCQPGERVTLPCTYHYEDHTNISQLSVQWRSPNNELLCHYIKHKAFQNCTAGYAFTYSPGSITLSILHVNMDDFGSHVCSVSKRHEFTDFSVDVVKMSDSVTSTPQSGSTQSGLDWRLVLLHSLVLFVCNVCM